MKGISDDKSALFQCSSPKDIRERTYSLEFEYEDSFACFLCFLKPYWKNIL